MITLLLSILITITFLWNVSRRMKPLGRLPPGPRSFPVIGALHLFRDQTKRPYEILTELSQKYGPIFSLQMGSIYTVVLTDPALIREALRRDEYAGRAPLYLTHGIMGGKGIICAEGPLWKNQRKFSIQWLRHLGMGKNETDKRLMLEARIMKHVKNGLQSISKALREGTYEIDLQPILCHNVGNAINDLIFGVTYPEGDKTWEYLLQLQTEGIEYIGVSGAVNFLPFLRFLPKNRKVMKFILEGKEKTHQIYTKLIRDAEARLQAGEQQQQHLEPPTNILEFFVRERNQRSKGSSSPQPRDPEFSDSQLNHLLADLFGAGLDTTMTTVRWTLLYVALNPRVQQRLREEFEQAIPAGADVQMQFYDSLLYLRACIAEAQRIRSVVPMGIPHGTTVDTQLADFHIPKNTMVLPLQWAVHMNPREWPEPDIYKPERFYDVWTSGGGGRGDATSPSSSTFLPHFLPFQTGKRMCLGDDLAKMLLFLVTGNILRRFWLSMDMSEEEAEEEKGHMEMLLRGVDGFTLTPERHKFRIRELIVVDGE